MTSRDWWWLRTRIEGLLTAPPQIAIAPSGRIVYVQQTRIAIAFDPPFPDD
jgi:hypothetical protein